MFYTVKAYVNSLGRGQVHLLGHDVKRAIADSRMAAGLVNVLSTQATVSLKIMENDKKLQEEYFKNIFAMFKDGDASAVSRRSGTGADIFHLMAAEDQLSLTFAFAAGKTLLSPFHDVLALDYEVKPGRREFIINVLGDPPAQAKAPPPGAR